ncbi:Sec1-binding region of Mso1-domain-containing protein, partial [Microdochium bolleyi]
MSWYSSLVSTASSKVSNLQRTFLNSETDGDTEDDTHVCRVLRSYYTEKGKPFPGWLPPDPKAPPPPVAVYSQPASQVGARYGAAAAGGPQQQQQGGGGLSSLWDKNAAPQQQQQEVQSLRRGRNVPPAMRGSDTRQNPFRNSDPMG